MQTIDDSSRITAAINAAGHECSSLRSVDDLPEIFSRPLWHLFMQLYESANDTQRQRLLGYIGRLACAGSSELEQERATYIRESVIQEKRSDFIEAMTLLPPDF